jgi:predicted DNA-binding transcriptional regulator YafY
LTTRNHPSMNRIDRLFGISTFLQSRKYVTAEAISEKFGISVRTVYRDIKALCEQGIPVSFEQNKGYYIMQGYFLPPVSLSSDEANALLLVETVVYGIADKSIQNHYSSALAKVRNVLRGSQKEKLESLQNTMRMQLPSFINHDFEYLSLLQTSISSKTIIVLDYKNNKEESSRREVEPIGLIFYAFNWHLIAWCHKREEYRDFRVSRIVKLCPTETPFRKKDHMALEEYMKELPVAY